MSLTKVTESFDQPLEGGAIKVGGWRSALQTVVVLFKLRIVFLLLMVLNPSYESRLFMPGPTLCIPIGALVMMVLGFLIIRRLIQLEV